MMRIGKHGTQMCACTNLQTFKKTKYILSKIQIESYIQYEIYEPMWAQSREDVYKDRLDKVKKIMWECLDICTTNIS